MNPNEGKLPPQAIELEERLLGCVLTFEQTVEAIQFLKAEHFYKDAHQMIWTAIQELQHPNISSVTQYLRKQGTLDRVGGAHYLTTLSGKFASPSSLEYMARIIQQMFIKREVIRISGQNIRNAYDDSIDCIELFDTFISEIETVEQIFNPEVSTRHVISTIENERDYLDQARQGILKMGLSTGFERFDEFFRFKPSSFVIANGHDNVGKTAVLVFLAVVSNRLHKWKWTLCCLENQEAHIRMETIQFVTGRHISKLTAGEYEHWYNWSVENFTIIRISNLITAERLMRICQKIHNKNPKDAILIDPYNALDVDLENTKLSSHEYHYKITGMFRNYIKKNSCCIYLNTHAITDALRNKHKDGDYQGYPMPPEKADTEGGGKFSNRADDFLTIHRYVQHPDEMNVAHIHVRKIKVNQTGGHQTVRDSPVKLQMMKGYFGFFDENGYSPLQGVKHPSIQSKQDHYSNEKSDDAPF